MVRKRPNSTLAAVVQAPAPKPAAIVETAAQPVQADAKTAEPDLFEQVEALLASDQPQQALSLLNREKQKLEWMVNAQAVCQLRLGKFEQAMELLRGRVLAASSVCLRGDIPPALAVNFATALLLMGNVDGCVSALHDIKDQQHAGVRQLNAAIADWRRGLTFGQKVRLWFGSAPIRPVELGFPPGVLN
jgi:hypothetical protein